MSRCCPGMSPHDAEPRSPPGPGGAPPCPGPGCSACGWFGGRRGRAGQGRCRFPRARSRPGRSPRIPEQMPPNMPTEGLHGVGFDLLPDHLAAHGATPALEPEVTPMPTWTSPRANVCTAPGVRRRCCRARRPGDDEPDEEEDGPPVVVDLVRLKLIAPGRPLRAHNSAEAPAGDMALIALRVPEP
jgi:hypothetical protein